MNPKDEKLFGDNNIKENQKRENKTEVKRKMAEELITKVFENGNTWKEIKKEKSIGKANAKDQSGETNYFMAIYEKIDALLIMPTKEDKPEVVLPKNKERMTVLLTRYNNKQKTTIVLDRMEDEGVRAMENKIMEEVPELMQETAEASITKMLNKMKEKPEKKQEKEITKPLTEKERNEIRETKETEKAILTACAKALRGDNETTER